MRLGAHVSAREAVHLAVDRAVALGCECLQVFLCNPRQWAVRPLSAEAASECRTKLEAASLRPLIAHAPYLVNLAGAAGPLRERSIETLTYCVRAIRECGGGGVVTHVGSRQGAPERVGIRRVAAALRRVLRTVPEGHVLLENSAGSTVGGSFEELARILDALDGDARVGICLDTAHLFAWGWDLRTEAGVKTMLDRVSAVLGLERVRLFHLNDSKSALGSKLDRHENIGEGTIGAQGFRTLLTDARLADHAGVLEVPGYERQGPDRRNLETLRALSRPLRQRPASPGDSVQRPTRRRRRAAPARPRLVAT